ncbi:MAG: exodeoxyribonuclease VII small subunit [Bacteroidia bacterium]|nr:exodeoxyribonuclease VII small subunit [Bacteroidia bacterium]
MKMDDLTFEEAFRELENIVKSLEDNTLTIDDITSRINRAAGLIAHCRQKLTTTDLEVQKILNELDSGFNGKAPETAKEN